MVFLCDRSPTVFVLVIFLILDCTFCANVECLQLNLVCDFVPSLDASSFSTLVELSKSSG